MRSFLLLLIIAISTSATAGPAKKTTQLPAFKAKRKSQEVSSAPTVVMRAGLETSTPKQEEKLITAPVLPPVTDDVRVGPPPDDDEVTRAIREARKPVPPAQKNSAPVPAPQPVIFTVRAMEPEVTTLSHPAEETELRVGEQAASSIIPREIVLEDEKRLALKTSYLNARYSRLAADLEDGASSLALIYSQRRQTRELRASLELGHGFDQRVNLQNTRFVIVRADYVQFFDNIAALSPYLSGGLGWGDFNVRSFRGRSGENILVREHLHTMALAVVPGAGVRLSLSEKASLDLGIEYMALIGTGQSSALGGFSLGAALGFPF